MNALMRSTIYTATLAVPSFVGAYFLHAAMHAPWLPLGTGIFLVASGIAGACAWARSQPTCR